MTRQTPLIVSVTFLIISSLAAAQMSPKPAATESGMTAYVQFGGTANSDGAVYALNPSIGYDFNAHFGLAIGTPIYFIRPSASTGASDPDDSKRAQGWKTQTINESEMALFLGVHTESVLKNCLTPPTLLEMVI